MSESPESAERQILAAARQILQKKTRQLSELPAENFQQLSTELAGRLSAEAAALLAALPASPERILGLLSGVAPERLPQIYDSFEKGYQSLFLPEQAPVERGLALLDFGEDEDDGFSLLDFDAPAASGPNPEVLRQAFWVLLQLTAAWYYVHQVAKAS